MPNYETRAERYDVSRKNPWTSPRTSRTASICGAWLVLPSGRKDFERPLNGSYTGGYSLGYLGLTTYRPLVKFSGAPLRIGDCVTRGLYVR